MALLSVIRRWHYRDHLSIREIVRRTGLSRNTIRKYLRSETIEPLFKVPERPSKLDPFADRLSAWLQREMARSRKQKRTVKQLHADLASLGYDGSYGRVAAFVICPLLSGPKLMIFWITKETWNAEQEASPGRDYRQAA